MESHISQNWSQVDTDNDADSNDNDDDFSSDLVEQTNSQSDLTERGSDLWNRTMDVLDSIQTKEDADDLHKLLIVFKSKINGRNARGNDCSFFGAEVSNFRNLKRRRYKNTFEGK